MTTDWTQVLFEGLAGALIGSAATIAVVVATIRHDSRARQKDRLDDAVGRAHAAFQQYTFALAIDGLHSRESLNFMRPALQAISEVLSRSQHVEPRLSALLETASKDLAANMELLDTSPGSETHVVDSARRLAATLGYWFSDPDAIRSGKLTYESVRAQVDPGLYSGQSPASKQPHRRDKPGLIGWLRRRSRP